MDTSRLDAARRVGDPPADAFVDGLVAERGPAAFRELFTRMIGQVELPLPQLAPEQANWLAVSRELPAWADAARIDRAQMLFRDHGPKILLLLYYKSLPLLYTNARGAEVLIRTGRLHRQEPDWRNFARRIAETAQFLVWLMPAGSLTEPDGDGRAITQRIRLIHASIRHTVQAGGDWDAEALGRPINQEDLLMTLLTFGIATADGLRDQFGLPVDSGLIDDYVHFWNVVGHLLGIETDLLPADGAAARAALEHILRRQAASSPAGHQLADALVRFSAETLRFEQLQTVPAELVRFCIGGERAAMLGISAPAGCLGVAVPHFLAALFRLGERLEDRARPERQQLLDRVSALVVTGMTSYFDRYKQRPFVVPEVLLEAWRLQRFG
jgi:hypothetical protein